MTDVLTPSQRRKCMSSVKSKDTDIEVMLRSALHARGLRFRKHVKNLPGTPDLVFTRARVAVFIDGDFWHGYRFRKWKDNLKPFWRDKIETNRQRDIKNFCALRGMGWKVLRVWKHDIKKNLPATLDRIERTWSNRVNTISPRNSARASR